VSYLWGKSEAVASVSKMTTGPTAMNRLRLILFHQS